METIKQDAEERDRLMDDLKLFLKDAADLLMGTRRQVDQAYQVARSKFASTSESAMAGSREMLDVTNRYVQEHPWQSVGIGAMAGLVLGLWLFDRR